MTEIILGPPGTGKTTTLLSIVDEELERGTPPDRIGYFSFTRRAADEAAERACKKFKLKRADLPHFRTLHSMCFRALGMTRGDVFEGAPVKEFADYAGVRISGNWSQDGTLVGFDSGDRALHVDNMARVKCIPLREQYDEDDDPSLPWPEIDRIARALQEFKSAHALVDYTDMLMEFIASDINLKLEVLIVDEAQDLSELQWRVVDKMSSGCRRVVVAGDDDQAIYSWAGANVERLLSMEGDVRVLDQSWRVPMSVQDVALRLSGEIAHRRQKLWHPRDAEGRVEDAWSIYDVEAEDDSVLILARNTYLLDSAKRMLRNRGIVYEHNGYSSIKSRFLEAAEMWEVLRKGEALPASDVRKVYDLVSSKRGIAHGFKKLPGYGDDEMLTIEKLREAGGLLLEDMPWHEALDRIPAGDLSYMLAARRRAAERGERLRERPHVRVSTIHTAKGAEADHVVLMLEMAARSHREADRHPDDELRVWYVGVTRAKERLTLVDSSNNMRCRWL